MKKIDPYLMFDGNCAEAMEFYNKCLGGELFVMKFGEAPPDTKKNLPPGSDDRVIHAAVKKGDLLLMASDVPPGMPLPKGDNFNLHIECETVEEVEKLFKALGEGGKVLMPLGETFWAHRFVGFKDRFGTNWMLNKSKPMPM